MIKVNVGEDKIELAKVIEKGNDVKEFLNEFELIQKMTRYKFVRSASYFAYRDNFLVAVASHGEILKVVDFPEFKNIYFLENDRILILTTDNYLEELTFNNYSKVFRTFRVYPQVNCSSARNSNFIVFGCKAGSIFTVTRGKIVNLESKNSQGNAVTCIDNYSTLIIAGYGDGKISASMDAVSIQSIKEISDRVDFVKVLDKKLIAVAGKKLLFIEIELIDSTSFNLRIVAAIKLDELLIAVENVNNQLVVLDCVGNLKVWGSNSFKTFDENVQEIQSNFVGLCARKKEYLRYYDECLQFKSETYVKNAKLIKL